MLTIILAIGLCVALLKWLSRYVGTLALLYYITQKGCNLPNDQELKNCTQYVVKRLIKDITGKEQ